MRNGIQPSWWDRAIPDRHERSCWFALVRTRNKHDQSRKELLWKNI